MYGIPFKAYATPDTLASGDLVALYAGNDSPRYTTTVTGQTSHPNPAGEVTIQTSDGPFVVPADSRIWVAAWAPLADLPATPTRPTYSRAQRHAARFAPMGVR